MVIEQCSSARWQTRGTTQLYPTQVLQGQQTPNAHTYTSASCTCSCLVGRLLICDTQRHPGLKAMDYLKAIIAAHFACVRMFTHAMQPSHMTPLRRLCETSKQSTKWQEFEALILVHGAHSSTTQHSCAMCSRTPRREHTQAPLSVHPAQDHGRPLGVPPGSTRP